MCLHSYTRPCVLKKNSCALVFTYAIHNETLLTYDNFHIFVCRYHAVIVRSAACVSLLAQFMIKHFYKTGHIYLKFALFILLNGVYYQHISSPRSLSAAHKRGFPFQSGRYSVHTRDFSFGRSETLNIWVRAQEYGNDG